MLCDGLLGNLIKAMSRRCEAMFGCRKLCAVKALIDVGVGCTQTSWFLHASWRFDIALLWDMMHKLEARLPMLTIDFSVLPPGSCRARRMCKVSKHVLRDRLGQCISASRRRQLHLRQCRSKAMRARDFIRGLF